MSGSLGPPAGPRSTSWADSNGQILHEYINQLDVACTPDSSTPDNSGIDFIAVLHLSMEDQTLHNPEETDNKHILSLLLTSSNPYLDYNKTGI